VFTVLVWGENRSKFGTPENEYQGKRVCVTGKITEYRGTPEIVANDPAQIKIDSR
jgi:micrococcal nuclease